jgi:hypothetical protein
MRTIPRRTDPLTRATMPAITSTAAMIHKMVSVLPPPLAASIPRAPNMSPPFILGNNTRRFRPLLPGAMHHSIGDLAKVLDKPRGLPRRTSGSGRAVPIGFSRVPISTGLDYYRSLQYFGPHQIAYAHTHPDSEEWVTVFGGNGQARFGMEKPLSLNPGIMVAGAERQPLGFLSGPEPMSPALDAAPAPCGGATSWDQPGTGRIPIHGGRPGGPAAAVFVAAATAHRVRPARSAARTARSRSELAKQ